MRTYFMNDSLFKLGSSYTLESISTSTCDVLNDFDNKSRVWMSVTLTASLKPTLYTVNTASYLFFEHGRTSFPLQVITKTIALTTPSLVTRVQSLGRIFAL